MFRNFIRVSERYANGVYLADECIELVCIGIIMFLFRSMFRGTLFDINSSDYDNELINMVGLVNAKVPNGFSVQSKSYLPMLLITPKGKTNIRYENLLVANPIKQNYLT